MVITNALYVELTPEPPKGSRAPDEAPKGSGINDRPPSSEAPKGTSTTPKLDDNTSKPGDFAAKSDAMFRKNGRWACRWDVRGNSAEAAGKSAADKHAKPKK
jgi:hypothetical protein